MAGPLVITGSIFLIVSLLLAWLGVAVLILRVPALVRIFPTGHYVIKSHIDYLLMALLAYTFHMLADSYPVAIVLAIIIGGTLNPFFFLLMAARPKNAAPPGPIFNAIATLSFIATTIGFGGAALLVAL